MNRQAVYKITFNGVKMIFGYSSIKYLVLFFALLFLAIALSFHPQDLLSDIIVFLGLSSVVAFLILKKRKDYFEPIFLFSIYYVFVYIAALATYARGFENNLFISATHFYGDIESVYHNALFICFLSYLFVLLGYMLFVRKTAVVKPKHIYGISNSLFLLVALCLYLIGLLNFIYNVLFLYSGDIVAFYRNISLRHVDFAQGGTTLGYNFMYAGAYMLFVRMLQLNKSFIFTYFLVFLSFAVYASSGRITNTVFYISSFLMIYYYNRGVFSLNNKFLMVGCLVSFFGVFFYALRYASSLHYNNMYDFSSDGLSFFVEFFKGESLAFFLIDKGNIPNFAVLMKVVDSWGRDIGYMWGGSLLFPFYGFLSSNLFGLIEMPAVITKEVWYPHILGGNLPVTGMGEMVLNFSIIGFPVGMFMFGVMGAFFRNIFLIKRSNIYLIFFSGFCFFFLIYPKGEFNNFNLFWMAFPSLVFTLTVFFVRSFSSNGKT